MQFPMVSAITAGMILMLQMILAFTVSATRGKNNTWIGDGENVTMRRVTRRHSNLAENAGIFMTALTLLELSGHSPVPLIYLCGAFLVARVSHAVGLSRENTNNIFRLIGGIGTYFLGMVLGGMLIWIALNN